MNILFRSEQVTHIWVILQQSRITKATYRAETRFDSKKRDKSRDGNFGDGFHSRIEEGLPPPRTHS